jgi:hypothetical protein
MSDEAHTRIMTALPMLMRAPNGRYVPMTDGYAEGVSGRRVTAGVLGIGAGMILFALALASRSSGTSVATPITTTATTVPQCQPTRVLPNPSCSLPQVVAAFAREFDAAGATKTEAGCLARIDAPAFKRAMRPGHLAMPSGVPTPADIKCVGSASRMKTINDSVLAYLDHHQAEIRREIFGSN